MGVAAVLSWRARHNACGQAPRATAAATQSNLPKCPAGLSIHEQRMAADEDRLPQQKQLPGYAAVSEAPDGSATSVASAAAAASSSAAAASHIYTTRLLLCCTWWCSTLQRWPAAAVAVPSLPHLLHSGGPAAPATCKLPHCLTPDASMLPPACPMLTPYHRTQQDPSWKAKSSSVCLHTVLPSPPSVVSLPLMPHCLPQPSFPEYRAHPLPPPSCLQAAPTTPAAMLCL